MKNIILIFLFISSAIAGDFVFVAADSDTVAIAIGSPLFFADSGRVIFDIDTTDIDTGRYIILNFLAFLDKTNWGIGDSLAPKQFFLSGGLWYVRQDSLDSLGEFARKYVGRGLWDNGADSIRVDLQASSGLDLRNAGLALDRTDAANYNWTNETHNFDTDGYIAGGAPFYVKDSSNTNRAFLNYTVSTKDYLTFGNSLFPTVIKGGNTTSAIEIDNGVTNINDLTLDISLKPQYLAYDYGLADLGGDNDLDVDTTQIATKAWIGNIGWYWAIEAATQNKIATNDTLNFDGQYAVNLTATANEVNIGVDTTLLATRKYVGDQGYLTSYTETDPIYSAWDKSTGILITESQVSDLNHYNWFYAIEAATQPALADGDTLNFDGQYAVNITPAAKEINIGIDTTLLATRKYVDTSPAGDITAVTAGSGLSGGGTSGDVTLSLDGVDNRNYPHVSDTHSWSTSGGITAGGSLESTGGYVKSTSGFTLDDSAGTNQLIMNYVATTVDYYVFGSSSHKTVIKGASATNAIEVDAAGTNINTLTLDNALDISSYTNLTASSPIAMSGDDITFNYDATDFDLLYGTHLEIKAGAIDTAKLNDTQMQAYINDHNWNPRFDGHYTEQWLSALNLHLEVTSPSLATFKSRGEVWVLPFAGTGAGENVWGTFTMPYNWDEATDIYFGFKFYPGGTTTDNFVFNFTYRWNDLDETSASVAGLKTMTYNASMTDDYLYDYKSSAIAGIGHTKGSVIHFEFERNPASASDTYTGIINIVGVALIYKIDDIGSDTTGY